MAYRDTVITDAPVDYYEMETSTGTDAGSGARTAALTSITLGPGNAGNGWVFNGTTSQVTMSTFPGGTAVANMTLEAWFKSPSNGGWTNDYPTFVRRDGTDIILIRGRSSNFVAGNNPGKAEVYWAGTTLTSTNRVDDGAWHHIVATAAGNAIKLYVDGVLQGSGTASKTTYNLGTAAAYIGGNSGLSAEYYQGTLDNVAIYSTALTQARISAHYTAGLPVSTTYVASAMTGNGIMPTAVAIPVADKTVSATAMTGSATMPDASAYGTVDIIASRDFIEGTDGPSMNVSPPYRISMDFDLPGGFTNAGLKGATLNFFQGGTSAGSNITITKITAEWADTDTSFSTGASVSISAATGGWRAVDVSSLVTQTGFYGFLITSNASNTIVISSRETTNKPHLALSYQLINMSGGYTAQPMTGGASMPNANAKIDAVPVISPMTATGSMPTATVSAQHDGKFVAEAMSASATMPDAKFVYPATVVASAMTASANSPTATPGVTTGVVIKAEPMTATARWVPPASVNGTSISQNDNEDPYFNRVTAQKPKYWWRFQDGGSVVKDAITGATDGTPSAIYRGGAIGNQSTAPEGRKAVHFPLGGSVEQNEPFGSNTDETTFIGTNSVVRTVLEFSIKTNKANQFVMAGADQTVGTNGVASNAGATELFVQNGKLGYRTYQYGSFGSNGTNSISKEFVGFKTVADNEWHHITIRSGIKSGVRDEYGVEIWVDGKMDVRRYFTQSWIGMPDYLGNRPAVFDSAVLPALPLSQNYEGDIAELVWYADTTHTEDDITRNYYAFFGYRPIAAPAMEASAVMPTAKGKGNQKKALYLYWSGNDEVFGGMPGKAGQTLGESVSFDPMPSLVNDSYAASLAPRTSEETGDFFGFKVFTKSITKNYSPLGVISYRDNVTDEQSLVDLTRDVDLTEYDVIMFKDWPDEGYERDFYEANYPGQIERILNQLRDANDAGIGLYVTNPRLAVDLGVIDSVEFVQPLTERKSITGQGRASGLYDYGSALKFPWNIVGADGLTGNAFAAGIGEPENTSPSYLASKAYFYYDNNRNNKFRVVAKINGLTDLPSYMLEDAVFHVDADQYGWEGAAYKYLHRETGLEIGDEYIFNGAPTIDARWMENVESRYLRGNGTWATPPGHVKAGTVVTTFGSKQFVNNVETTNPYQNYATTIVLESGTILNGRSTHGRIFVNFTETPSSGLDAPVQVLPGSQDALDNPLGLAPDELSLDTNTATFISTGTPQQDAWVEQALSRATFPFDKLQARIKARWGRTYLPIVWENIAPGEDEGTLGRFNALDGTVQIDENACRQWATGKALNLDDLVMSTLIHEIGHMVDYVYLQPYQRVNIWNVFHGPWNTYHTDPVTHNRVFAAEYILPPGYPMDITTSNVKNNEGWSGGSYSKGRISEAFAQAFVQAYSDIPIDTNAYMPHPAPESIGPMIRAAIETGPGAYLFDESQVDSAWPIGYTPETNAQREWEYSWTRTSLSFSSSVLKTRVVSVVMPDGSTQQITQGSTVKTRDNVPLSMVRSGQLFPVISKPRLEMDARGIYWLADAPKVAAGDVVVRATPMEANAVAPSANVIAQRSTVVIAQAMTATAQMPESAQAKSGNVLYLANAMTAEARMSQGNERTIKAEPMTATATMPDAVNKFTGEVITLRLPRPARITLRIKEAV